MIDILLAEDNEADVLLVKHALERHHVPHRLHVVRDGEEAIRFMKKIGEPGHFPCPSLLLLDLNMPNADGSEILQEFRQHPSCGTAPVIVVSSSDLARDRARMNSVGIDKYFRKPSDFEEFMELGAIVKALMQPALTPPC